MTDHDKNEALMYAVENCDLQALKVCLESGADPNYFRYYDAPDLTVQPTTPLKMVMFRISDCMLQDNQLIVFAEIAKVLLQYGADPKPAMIIAEARYGKYGPEPDNLFMKVWRVVAEANPEP